MSIYEYLSLNNRFRLESRLCRLEYLSFICRKKCFDFFNLADLISFNLLLALIKLIKINISIYGSES